MQFSNIFVTALAVAGPAYAGCFTRGDGNGQGDGRKGAGLTENQVIDNVSNLLRGWYLSNEDRTQCAMDTFQNKWRFYVKNTGGSTAEISYDDVKHWLENEAYGCQYGGKSTQNGVWEIISDPNPGLCVSTGGQQKRQTTTWVA